MEIGAGVEGGGEGGKSCLGGALRRVCSDWTSRLEMGGRGSGPIPGGAGPREFCGNERGGGGEEGGERAHHGRFQIGSVLLLVGGWGWWSGSSWFLGFSWQMAFKSGKWERGCSRRKIEKLNIKNLEEMEGWKEREPT